MILFQAIGIALLLLAFVLFTSAGTKALEAGRWWPALVCLVLAVAAGTGLLLPFLDGAR